MPDLPEKNPNVFTQDRIWEAYAAALRTSSDPELAASLGISESKLKAWKEEHPAFYRAILAARESGGHQAGQKISTYVASVLPPDLRELWDELTENKMEPDERLRINLSTRGEFDKQRLLCYGLTVTSYDVNKCCRLLGIPKSQLDRWIADDPRFGKLFEEVAWAQKNFLEAALMAKVAKGDTKAIIFANETKNRDRGFGRTVKVEGQINHSHAHAFVDLTTLPIDIATKAKILEACKNKGLVDLDGLLETDPMKQRIVDGEVMATDYSDPPSSSIENVSW